jgi:GTPase SAR1 family protein
MKTSSSSFENPHPNGVAGGLHKVPEFKVILVGNSGVGKTCIVVRATKDLYQEQNPTIGFAFQKLHK